MSFVFIFGLCIDCLDPNSVILTKEPLNYNCNESSCQESKQNAFNFLIITILISTCFDNSLIFIGFFGRFDCLVSFFDRSDSFLRFFDRFDTFLRFFDRFDTFLRFFDRFDTFLRFSDRFDTFLRFFDRFDTFVFFFDRFYSFFSVMVLIKINVYNIGSIYWVFSIEKEIIDKFNRKSIIDNISDILIIWWRGSCSCSERFKVINGILCRLWMRKMPHFAS